MSIYSSGVSRCLMGLMVGVSVLLCAMTSAEEYEGNLIIYNKPDASGQYVSINCRIPFVSATLNFHSNSLGCENDDAYGFKLENVPSASFFAFYDDPACSGSGGFAYRFKTVKHPTNMAAAMSIKEAGEKEVNKVVVAGVMLISTQSSGQVEGKLSCVKIERSAVPTP